MNHLPQKDKDDMATVAMKALAGGPASTAAAEAMLFSAEGWKGVRAFPPVMAAFAAESGAAVARREWTEGALEHGGAFRRGDLWCAPQNDETPAEAGEDGTG